MADVEFVSNDTAPSISGSLTDSTGAPINLSAALTTVRFQMRLTAESRFAVDAAATITDAPNGNVRYDFVAGDLASAGDYVARWQITWADGQTQHSDPANTITIVAE